MNRLILSAVAFLCLTSCFNDVSYTTDYILKPHEQGESSGDYLALGGVVAYAFAGTTDDWEVLSYEDALAGVITSIETGEQRTAFVEAVPYNESDTELLIALDRIEVILVAVDPATEVYAYTNYTVPQNFSEVLVDIVFRPWKTSTYTASTWTFVVPEVEEEEDDESSTTTE